jgi:hypothetical protein
MSIGSIFVGFLKQLDIWINDHLLFGKNETLSARMGRSLESDSPNPLAKAICNLLDIMDRDHCRESYEALLKRQEEENEEE